MVLEEEKQTMEEQNNRSSLPDTSATHEPYAPPSQGPLSALISDVRRRGPELLRLAVVALLSIPLWPIVIFLAASATGRSLIMRGLSRLGGLDVLVWDILDRLGIRPYPVVTHTTDFDTLLFSPEQPGPLGGPGITFVEQQQRLMWLLSPQYQHLVCKAGYPDEGLDIPERQEARLVSLSTGQQQLLQVVLANRPGQEHDMGEPQ